MTNKNLINNDGFTTEFNNEFFESVQQKIDISLNNMAGNTAPTMKK